LRRKGLTGGSGFPPFLTIALIALGFFSADQGKAALFPPPFSRPKSPLPIISPLLLPPLMRPPNDSFSRLHPFFSPCHLSMNDIIPPPLGSERLVLPCYAIRERLFPFLRRVPQDVASLTPFPPANTPTPPRKVSEKIRPLLSYVSR